MDLNREMYGNRLTCVYNVIISFRCVCEDNQIHSFRCVCEDNQIHSFRCACADNENIQTIREISANKIPYVL